MSHVRFIAKFIDMQSDKFTPQAARLWAQIPEAFQTKLLANVYCGKCGDAVNIANYTGAVKCGDLVLQGQCATCGGEVARLIESQ